jgi:hypothetical protein
MSMRTPAVSRRSSLLAAAMLWLLVGGVLLATTLVPMHTATFGWTPAFWLVGAPLSVLLGLEPSLVRQCLARRRRRHPASPRAVWH